MDDYNTEWKPNGRPTSVIALNFSTALDDIFNLGPFGELASKVEQKKNEVKSHERQLEDLATQLRQADERLKRLQSKHKRMQSENILSSRTPHSRLQQQQHSSSDSEESQSSSASDPTDRA